MHRIYLICGESLLFFSIVVNLLEAFDDECIKVLLFGHLASIKYQLYQRNKDKDLCFCAEIIRHARVAVYVDSANYIRKQTREKYWQRQTPIGRETI